MARGITRCCKCGTMDDLVPDKSKASGFASWCRTHDRERRRERYWASRVDPPPGACEVCGVEVRPLQRFCATHLHERKREQRERSRKPRRFRNDPCSIPECPNVLGQLGRKISDGRHLCKSHLNKFQAHGDPLYEPPPRRPKPPKARAKRPPKVRGARVRLSLCPQCGAVFLTPNHRRVYCTDRCAAKAQKDQRRAHEKNAFKEKVYRRQIFGRDGWICQLCGEPVERDAFCPGSGLMPESLFAPTIDHIIPLDPRCGGTHEPGNVQTAHFLCNSVKGSRIDGDAKHSRPRVRLAASVAEAS